MAINTTAWSVPVLFFLHILLCNKYMADLQLLQFPVNGQRASRGMQLFTPPFCPQLAGSKLSPDRTGFWLHTQVVELTTPVRLCKHKQGYERKTNFPEWSTDWRDAAIRNTYGKQLMLILVARCWCQPNFIVRRLRYDGYTYMDR